MTDIPIAAVARDTGLSRDTLRVWERRYGFPSPARDAHGERMYSASEVEQLRVVKRLIDAGHRPGRLLAMAHEERQQLAQQDVLPAAAAPSGERAAAATPGHRDELALLHALDREALRQRLMHDVARLGLSRFLAERLAPLNAAIGEAWMRGELAVYEEHVYTGCVQSVLHHALAGLPSPAATARPRVLLATLPGEPHGLGLLMAEMAFVLDGAGTLSLGVQTPLVDIDGAAQAYGADIVALSVSGCTPVNQTIDDLRELRQRLPAGCEIWIGGHAPALSRRGLAGVTLVDALDSVPGELARWRASAGASPAA